MVDIFFDSQKLGVRHITDVEHSLVYPSGSFDYPSGVIPLIDGSNGTYMVKAFSGGPDVVKHMTSETSFSTTIFVQYSIPNIENIRRSHLYPLLSSHLLYVPALLYPCGVYSKSADRKISVLSTFLIPGNVGRRSDLLNKLGDQILNVNDVFEWKKTQALYSDTKILVNVHQTNDWQTFEELRVLPALLCGVVVISEYRNPVPRIYHLGINRRNPRTC